MAAYDGDQVLVSVNGDDDAYLLIGEASFASLPEAVCQVGVADICFVDPDAVSQDDVILVSVYGGEHAVTPFIGSPMRDQAYLGCGIEWHVEAHEIDEINPSGQVFLATGKNRCRERVEAAPA